MNINLTNISTEDLLKELEFRGYKAIKIKQTAEKKESTKQYKEIKINPDCKKIFDEKTQQELQNLLNGYTKPEINKFYNQIIGKEYKMTGSKQDYIDIIINLKKAVNRTKVFQNI